MQSDAKTPEEYLSELVPARREAISAVRTVILDNLPDGYDEVMQYGMISYIVPLSVIPDTYNGQPLMYIALASQKHYMSLYLTTVYADQSLSDWFQTALSRHRQKAQHGQILRPFPQARKPAPRPGRRSHRPHTSRQIRRRDQVLQISLEPQIAYSQGNCIKLRQTHVRLPESGRGTPCGCPPPVCAPT